MTPTDQQLQTYDALQSAAERIARAAGQAQIQTYRATRKGRRDSGLRHFRFDCPATVRQLIDAASAVLAGEMTPNDGMALLHYDYHVATARTDAMRGGF